MGELPTWYLLTSQDHKKKNWMEGWRSLGREAGTLSIPAHFPERDTSCGLKGAVWKVEDFVGNFSEEVAVMVGPEQAVWWLAVMDVAAFWIDANDKKPRQMNSCRGKNVAHEHAEETCRGLLNSVRGPDGMINVYWQNKVPYCQMQRNSMAPSRVGVCMHNAIMSMNQPLVDSLQSTSWRRSTSNAAYGDAKPKLMNPGANGAIDWTKLYYHLNDDHILTWTMGSHTWRAEGGKVDPGMTEVMDIFLRGFVPATIGYLARLM